MILKISLLSLTMLTATANTYTRLRSWQPFNDMHDAFAQVQQEMIQMQEYMATAFNKVDQDVQASSRWYRDYQSHDAPETFSLTFHELSSDSIDAEWKEEENSLVITTDKGTITLAVHDNALLVTTNYYEKIIKDDQKQQSIFQQKQTYVMYPNGQLKSLEHADIKYDKNGTKDLIVTIQKEVKVTKKVPVAIS